MNTSSNFPLESDKLGGGHCEILNEATNSSMQLDLRIFSLLDRRESFFWRITFLHHVILTHVPIISPKNVSNLPTSRTGSRRDGLPLDRGWECILLLCRILWMTWYKSILSSAGKRRQSWVPHSNSISWESENTTLQTEVGIHQNVLKPHTYFSSTKRLHVLFLNIVFHNVIRWESPINVHLVCSNKRKF